MQLVNTAQQIPAIEVMIDGGGNEAQAFHATASGEAFLYDAGGHLLFHGGITASRGHEGQNAGREALTALIDGHWPSHRKTPVFGCQLSDHCRPEPTRISTALPHVK
jgi:hypothetical protein